ncbi:hydroxymethylpyrimidine/phosphomethylpyrimidine kinase [Halomonas sp. Bachu 37]|uniref:bifunctional hydroxymethylpyrimidine kinase/phosphomethylpyrimidine kinase n=1 Tax=Halomonas kashgarensis TaxID=3084920 RepID=UPI003217D1DB
MLTPLPPTILVLAGHDPSGGAGIIADCEAITACGGWGLSVPTALTVQDCRNVYRVMPVAPAVIIETADALADMQIAAIKVGLVADEATLAAVETVIRRYPGIPVVMDPVQKASGGNELSTVGWVDTVVDRLLPLVDILTPNRAELARLTSHLEADAEDTARAVELISRGCQAILVTGTDDPLPHAPADQVTHTLHTPDISRQWHWPRLEGGYHGSGCTLASALAARLAVGESLVQACEQAQEFTWQSLSHGYLPATGYALPNRRFQATLTAR